MIRADDGAARLPRSPTPTPRTCKQGSLGVALETFEPGGRHGEALEDTDAARHAADLTNAFVEGVGAASWTPRR